MHCKLLPPERRGGNETQCREIVWREFVVARGDAPEVLWATVAAALDDVAALVGLLVVANVRLAI
jgi:hypothetical protein